MLPLSSARLASVCFSKPFISSLKVVLSPNPCFAVNATTQLAVNQASILKRAATYVTSDTSVLTFLEISRQLVNVSFPSCLFRFSSRVLTTSALQITRGYGYAMDAASAQQIRQSIADASHSVIAQLASFPDASVVPVEPLLFPFALHAWVSLTNGFLSGICQPHVVLA